MANGEHLRILKQGVEVWNEWRRQNTGIRPDLGEAYLHGAYLSGAHLYGAYLSEANLRRANLSEANLTGADLSQADLACANLTRADLSGADLNWAYLYGTTLNEADLTRANLTRADLSEADLSDVTLRDAHLQRAIMINTNLTRATIANCRVHGLSAWGVILEEATQSDLRITPYDEPEVTVDDLEVAQFIYLLLNNQKLRNVIDTITSKAVLILGRFSPERKAVLDALREELRHHNYTPIVFDFETPASRNTTETVITLAGMSRFVIVDLTDPRCSPYEVRSFAPILAVPMQAICHASDKPFAMFPDLQRMYHWVLPPHTYTSLEELLADLPERIIAPAEAKVLELRKS